MYSWIKKYSFQRYKWSIKHFKTKSELINIFRKNKIDISKPIVFTCGSGMTACVLGMAYSLISDKNAVIMMAHGLNMEKNEKI